MAFARDRLVVSGLLFAASALHVYAAFMPDHADLLYQEFFWVVVAIEAALGALVLRGSPWGTNFAALTVVLLAVLFVATRIVPVPGKTVPESLEPYGLLTKAVELASLPFLARLIRSRTSRAARMSATQVL